MKSSSLLLGLAGAAFLTAGILGAWSMKKDPVLIPWGDRNGHNNIVSPPGTSHKPMRIVENAGKNLILSQDFEATNVAPDYGMDGWLNYGADDGLDMWQWGAVSIDDQTVVPHSGVKYLYNPGCYYDQDSWVVTPKATLQKGKTYEVSMFVQTYSKEGKNEHLQITVGRKNAIANQTTVIGEIKGSEIKEWTRKVFTFNPTSNGDYYFGIHCKTPAGSGAALIDDFAVVEKTDDPVLSTGAILNIGQVFDINPKKEADIMVYNPGGASLGITDAVCSEGISIEGLPLTVEAGGYAYIPVKVTAPEAGEFNGTVTLATNDPRSPEAEVKVKADVRKARVTGFNLEHFDNRYPEGWLFTPSVDVGITHNGLNNSYGVYFNSISFTGTFTTHFVEMGSDPEISFWYKVHMFSQDGKRTEPVKPDDVIMKVSVSDNFGESWDEVYSMLPGTDTQFNGVNDRYQEMVIGVPQYAGKRVQVKVVMERNPNKDLFKDAFIFNIDDMAIGTQRACDLGVCDLKAPAAVTAGNPVTFEVKVKNEGIEGQSGWQALLVDADSGEQLGMTDGSLIAAGDTRIVRIPFTPQACERRVKVRVSLQEDEDEANNESPTMNFVALDAGQSVNKVCHGNDVGSSPMKFNTGGECAALYLANEIGSNNAYISGMVLYSNADMAYESKPVQVYLYETDLPDFNAGEPDIKLSQFTKVYEGPVYMPVGDGEVYIPFDEPYHYRGRNLIVYTNNPNYDVIGGKYFYGTQTSDFRCLEESGNEMHAKQRIPTAGFVIRKEAAGKISGTVKCSGKAVSGAYVSLKDTFLSTVTDAEGYYSFESVAVGDYDVNVSCHSYFDKTVSTQKVTKDGETVCDIEMELLPRYNITGKVTADDGADVGGAYIRVFGYDEHFATTDANGGFVVSGVAGGLLNEYTVEMSAPYHDTRVAKVTVSDKDMVADVELPVQPRPVSSLLFAGAKNGVEISWAEPLTEFALDNGEYADGLGWDPSTVGHKICMGNVWRHNSRLHAASWYLNSSVSSHKTVHLYVFRLDQDGLPTKDVVFYQEVPNTDDRWNTFRFRSPLKCPTGFMIAVAHNEFLGLGITPPDDNHPFHDDDAYCLDGAYDQWYANWVQMAQLGRLHLMIRGEGEDNGMLYEEGLQSLPSAVKATVPDMNFTVFRLKASDADDSSKWDIIADEENTYRIIDDEPLEGDTAYMWAVVANYGNGRKSAPTFTDVFQSTGVDVVKADLSTALKICVFDSNGLLVTTCQPSDIDDIASKLKKGVHILLYVFEDGSVKTVKRVF